MNFDQSSVPVVPHLYDEADSEGSAVLASPSVAHPIIPHTMITPLFLGYSTLDVSAASDGTPVLALCKDNHIVGFRRYFSDGKTTQGAIGYLPKATRNDKYFFDAYFQGLEQEGKDALIRKTYHA